MNRYSQKLTTTDLRYIAIQADYDPRIATARATIRHRERGRMRQSLNIGKFESRRAGNDQALIDAAVNEMFRILGV